MINDNIYCHAISTLILNNISARIINRIFTNNYFIYGHILNNRYSIYKSYKIIYYKELGLSEDDAFKLTCIDMNGVTTSYIKINNRYYLKQIIGLLKQLGGNRKKILSVLEENSIIISDNYNYIIIEQENLQYAQKQLDYLESIDAIINNLISTGLGFRNVPYFNVFNHTKTTADFNPSL